MPIALKTRHAAGRARRQRLAVMVFTALQFASFAFTPQTLPTVSQEFRDAVGFMQNIVLLSSADMFAASFVATQGCVGALLAVMLVQESVEFAKFRSPERKAWQFLWLALSGFAGVCVTVFFVPITKMLLRAVDCTRVDGAWSLDALQPEAGAAPGSGSGSLDGGGGGDGGGMECWAGEHWVYVLSATMAFAVYVAISLRLLRVGGELGSLEVRRNVFDWSGDAQRKLPREHPLSFQNPTHGTVTSAGKLLVVAAQVLFGTNHPAKTMAFMLCVFAGLCAASFRYPPYYGALANRGRHFLDFAVLWVHLNTLLFYLTGSSLWVRAALPAQLALTATACALCKQVADSDDDSDSDSDDGSASPSGVERANPLEDALAYRRPSNVDRLRAALSPRSAGIVAYSPVAKEKE